MKISVIIPIFNSEKYLSRCIDSVVNQNYSDLEIILIDDGSTDNSSLVCEEYEKKYSQIRFYKQANRGVSVARNLGIAKATGKYIFFLDSDDLMCDGMLHYIGHLLTEDYDLLIGNIIHWNSRLNLEYIETSTELVKTKNSILDICEEYAKNELQIPWNPYQSVWNREIMLKHDLIFNSKLTVGEDCDFFFNFASYVKRIKVLDINFVKYRIDTEGSLIKNKNYNSIYSQLWNFNNLIKKFKDNSILRSYFADKFVSILFQIELLDKFDDKKKCYEFVFRNRQNIRYITKKIPKYFILDKVRKIIGIKRTVRLFSIIRSINHRLTKRSL